MAELTPLYMDISNVYSGDDLGLPWRDVMGEGVLDSGDLAVTQNGAGADLSVDIAAGAGWVTGDTNPDAQPTYRVRNDAVVNLGISPDASNPRKVLIVAQIVDETFAGVGRQWALEAIHGAPAPSPAEPALPDSALKLAVITVPAGATNIVTANITDSRVRAMVGGGSAASCLYDKREATVSTSGTTFAAGADLLSSDLEFDADGVSDYLVEVRAPAWYNNTSGDGVLIEVKLDGAAAGLLAEKKEAAASAYDALYGSAPITPTAGRHTLNARLYVTTGGTGNVVGGAGGAGNTLPIMVSVRKL